MKFLEIIRNIFKIPELRTRIFFTLGLLVVYRIGAHIPTPGIDGIALRTFLTEMVGPLVGFFDIFTGGALSKMTIFALGVMPYISAAIIFQLLTVVSPHIAKLSKEGESGRRQIVKYTRYATVGIAAIQALGMSIGIEGMADGMFVQYPGWPFRLLVLITLTSGTVFLMWVGEQITERGVGNGISLIIFAGIIAMLPSSAVTVYDLVAAGELALFFVIMMVIVLTAILVGIVFIERAQRKIPVQYARRVVGRKVFGGQTTYLPLKINTAGVIPPIFASAIIMFPATILGFIDIPWVSDLALQLAPGSIPYTILFGSLIFFFSFFYTAIIFNPVDVAENLQKHGGFVPGIRPGQKTSDYIYKVLTRLTFVGGLYLVLVCIIPELLIAGKLGIPFFFGGTSLLIVVAVALDTISQVESHLITRSYEGFLKKGKMKGRRN
ncbi:preprotein translocase subunit SecY [Thermodesulfovibrionales bacterium]|nr:preprotein translocase subunit SecY [Thermodesulfovibrionales bacterium]